MQTAKSKASATIHGKLTAIGYLIAHTEYGDEWSGAGMYEALVEVYQASTTTFTESYLKSLLAKAKDK